MAVAGKSMIANLVFGNDFATVSVASAMRKPFATIRSYCWRASAERFGT